MGSELKIEVTDKEKQYRAKNSSDIRGIVQREISCCSCGNVLSKTPGRIFSHSIVGIFQCEYCKKLLQKASFNSEKGDAVKLCYICGRNNKDTYGCKKEDCSYAFCKNCIKRSTPNSLPAAKSGGWECFACNTQPLWKLRGACAIVMSDLPKRTKEKVVESGNVSSDSEDSTSNLRNISYVKRSRLEETKRLGKRLKAVCDDESPGNPQSATDRQNKRGKSDEEKVATKHGVKQVSVDKSSRSRKNLKSSSEDTDLEEIVISKSKTVVKSQAEREKRNSKNVRTSEHRKSRNSESHSRKKVIVIPSSSDGDSDLENTSKLFRKDHRSTRESSVIESKSSNNRNKSSLNEKMPSTRQSKSHRKNYKPELSDDSLSDDSETEAIKGLKPSLFAKEKSGGDTKMKSKGGLKSSASLSSSVSSKTRSKPQDKIEEEEGEEDVKKKAKKSFIKSPGPKSYKEGKIPRRERSSDENEDSDQSVTRSSKNKEKRKSVTSRRDSEVGGFAKSIGRRLGKTDRQTSDSSSGKEFNKSKVVRSSLVALRPIEVIQEDHTTSPNEEPEIDDTSEIITKDQTFALKNSVNNFYDEMKTAAMKLLNDIEKARQTYSMKESMRVEEANRMVLETKKVAKRFRDIVDKGDTKVTEYYDKWCTKTRRKNVLKSSSSTPKLKSTSKSAEESLKKPVSVEVEEIRESSPEAEIINGANNVAMSECDSDEIFSNDETRMSIDKSGISTSVKNANQENDDVPIESSNSEAITVEKSAEVLLFSDKEISDNETKVQSPTMSQFSGLSDAEENNELQGKPVGSSVSETQIEKSVEDKTPAGDSENEQVKKSDDETEKLNVTSSESRTPRKIQSKPIVMSDSEINDSAMAVKTSSPLQTGRSDSEVNVLESSADIFDDTDKIAEITDDENQVRPTETKEKVADVVMKEPENVQDSLNKDVPDNKPDKSQESLGEDALNNESEKSQDTLVKDAPNNEPEVSHDSLDKDALNNESEKTLDEDPLYVEKNHDEVVSSDSCDNASASTELCSYSPDKLSDKTEDATPPLITEAEENAGLDSENDENDKEIVAASGPKEAKEDKDEEEERENDKKKVDLVKEAKKQKSKKQEKEKRKSETVKKRNETDVESGAAIQMQKVDSITNRLSNRHSSAETVLADDVLNDEKSHTEIESSASDEILESENAKAKAALLMSSNSDDSSCDERESNVHSTPNDGNDAPPTPPESDSKTDKNSIEHSHEIESTEKIRKKRSKFRIDENQHYIADEKLKCKCVIKVERIKEKILRRYSRALEKSRDYVESKNLKRLEQLDKLGKDQKKSNIDCSESDDGSSSKDLKRKKKAQATKEKEETLLDHLNKVKNGENISELGSASDSEGSTEENKEKDKNKSDDRLLAEANRMAKKRLLESSDSNADEEPVSDAKDDETSNKTKKVIKKEKIEKKSEEDEEKKEEESGKNRWRRSKILTLKISDSDTDAEEEKFNASLEKMKEKNKDGSQSESDEASLKKKKKQTRVRRRVLHSDSDAVISSEKSDSDSSVQSVKKKKKKEESSEDEKDKKKTRKRTRRTRRSSDSSSSLDERPKQTRRKRIKKTGSDSDSDEQDSPGKSGRKNIRKVLRDKQVAEDTKQAAKEEEERLKRIAERQKLYNEMYEVRLAGEEKVDKLVLDFNEETKEPLVSVHEGLVKRLKPHQAQGIKFMWDACFESLERIKSTKGSGCILAHCMGLGKSFQVVTLAHTLLTHEETGIATVLVVCPLSTVLNWANEFKIWLADIDNGDDIEVYEMTKMKKNFERKFQLARWQETGGVMIIGYEMFRNLTQQTGKKVRKNIQETFLKCLVDPGPDLIVCDEGHLLKNEDTALSKAMRRVKTLRRVVLTGTPLQNNLIEYHCMVQFVKPNLLGTKKEFMNRFENPITNGQFDDSTEYDVKLMKKRAHILHKLLEGSVQRFDYSVLTPFLPPKQEYVIFVKLTKIQLDMYQHYLDNYARRHRGVGGSLFADFQALQRIWTHPMVMQMNAEKVEKANEKKRLDATDSEGSLRDFIDDGSDTPCTSNSSDDASDDDNKKTKTKRSTRANPVVEEPVEEVEDAGTEEAATTDESQWWAQYVKEDDYEDIRCSSKLMILFRIIKESEQIGDKLLVFSQSLYSLTLIERFLELVDEETQKGNEPEKLDGLSGSWSLGLDYFRLDGQTSADNRRRWCDIFNRPSNTRARLFLISTRAGGLGINLTAANRVVIFDASWNPSHDVQSIFRIYRFGQKKPCYVYRLLAAGTMEEKIYNRQVTKLSLSCRVVDEQQIERHYSNNALAELYKLELPSETEKTLALPKDRLLAEIFLKYKRSVENYHEHDSLLENQAGEELDEEERQQAWLEYEEEKKGKRVMVPQPFINYQDAYLMQQINAMNMAAQPNNLNNPAMFSDYQHLQRLMEKDYPGIPEAQQKIMASQAVYEMYNYVEKQAMATHRGAGGGMQLPNLGGLQGVYSNQVTQAVNPRQTYMDILKMQQQQQLLAQQQRNGQIKFANSQQQLRADILRQQQQQQLQFAKQAQRMGQSSTTAAITIDDDEIMEVPSMPEQNPVPSAQASEANPKNKEE